MVCLYVMCHVCVCVTVCVSVYVSMSVCLHRCQAEFPTVICTSGQIMSQAAQSSLSTFRFDSHPCHTLVTSANLLSIYSYLFHPPLISLAPKNVIRPIIFHRRVRQFLSSSKSKSRSVEKHRQHSQGSQILARAPAALPRFAPLQSLGRRALQPVMLQ